MRSEEFEALKVGTLIRYTDADGQAILQVIAVKQDTNTLMVLVDCRTMRWPGLVPGECIPVWHESDGSVRNMEVISELP